MSVHEDFTGILVSELTLSDLGYDSYHWPVQVQSHAQALLLFRDEDAFSEHIESQGNRFMVTKVTDANQEMWNKLFGDGRLRVGTNLIPTSHYSLGSVIALSLRAKVTVFNVLNNLPVRRYGYGQRYDELNTTRDISNKFFLCDETFIYASNSLEPINDTCIHFSSHVMGKCELGGALCKARYELVSIK